MLTLADTFKKLSYTHLSELSISGMGSGQIPEAHRPKLIQRINEALVALYTRFPLRTKVVEILTYSTINEYVLAPEFSSYGDPDSEEEIRYIIDTEELPFPDDILMVESITGLDAEGERYTAFLNDRNQSTSWYVMSQDPITLYTDSPVADKSFWILYRALPDEIDLVPADPKAVRIRIPRTLEAALLAFVSGKIYGNMSMEGSLAKSQNFLDEYENECKIVEERNVLNSSEIPTNLSPKINGWP